MNPSVTSETRRYPVVLLCAPAGKDAALASNVLRHAAIASIVCRNVQDLSATVSDPDIGLVILAEEALTPASIDQPGARRRPSAARSSAGEAPVAAPPGPNAGRLKAGMIVAVALPGCCDSAKS